MKQSALLLIGVLLSFSAMADTPAPVLTATPVPVATPAAPLTEGEKKKLLSEFQKAQSNQRSALSHQEKSSMKELTSSQSMKQKKWREEQKKARQQFFDQHMSGPERRDYVQAYRKKLQEFDASIKAELVAAKKSWADRVVALKQTQKDQEAQFTASLAQGIRPAVTLWPVGN